MQDPPRSGVEPMSPALAGRFFTHEPAGKSPLHCLTLLSDCEDDRGFAPEICLLHYCSESQHALCCVYVSLSRRTVQRDWGRTQGSSEVFRRLRLEERNKSCGACLLEEKEGRK